MAYYAFVPVILATFSKCPFVKYVLISFCSGVYALYGPVRFEY